MPALPAAVAASLLGAFPSIDLQGAAGIGDGWNAVAWRIPEPAGDLVVRVPKLEWAGGEIIRQRCLAAELEAHDLPQPKDWQLLRDEAGSVLAGVYRYVEGRLAERGADDAALAPKLGAYLTALHDVPVSTAMRCGAQLLDPWLDRYQPLIDQYANSLPPPVAAWVRRCGEQLEAASATGGRRVIVHGDLQPGHIILGDDGRLAAVLDYSGPMVSDPAIDFGRLVQFWSPAFAAGVVATYGAPIDPHFAERARLYASLEPLRTIAVANERNLPGWVQWGKEQLAKAARA